MFKVGEYVEIDGARFRIVGETSEGSGIWNLECHVMEMSMSRARARSGKVMITKTTAELNEACSLTTVKDTAHELRGIVSPTAITSTRRFKATVYPR